MGKDMEDLIARVTAATGLDAGTAQKAIGAVLGFLQKEGPPAEVGQLLEKIPGGEEAMAAAAADGGGGGGLMGALGGLMGGGIMGLAGQLQGFGLGMGQIQTLGKELFAYGREVAGEDTMGAIAGAIPGLSQFV
jgi:predicted lipid-binding transport protein (Tim44 family)